MNRRQLSKQVGNRFRLRPLPSRVTEGGEELPPIDDFWRLDRVTRSPFSITLVNIHTGHAVPLQGDNLKEFRSPDFLLLRCELTITPSAITMEPITTPQPDPRIPRSFSIDRPTGDKSAGDWIAIHGTGAPVGWRVLVITWIVGSRCWLQPGSVEPDSHGDWVHPQCNLNTRKQRYVYALAVHPDDLARFERLFAERTFPAIPDLETCLGDAHINYVLSRRKWLLKAAV